MLLLKSRIYLLTNPTIGIIIAHRCEIFYHQQAVERMRKRRAFVTQQGRKRALFSRASGRISCRGKGLIPTPAKSAFYCVTHNQNCTHEKTGRGGYSIAAVSRLFSFVCPIKRSLLLRNSLINLIKYFAQHYAGNGK